VSLFNQGEILDLSCTWSTIAMHDQDKKNGDHIHIGARTFDISIYIYIFPSLGFDLVQASSHLFFGNFV
jgi:hypothetical protein